MALRACLCFFFFVFIFFCITFNVLLNASCMPETERPRKYNSLFFFQKKITESITYLRTPLHKSYTLSQKTHILN